MVAGLVEREWNYLLYGEWCSIGLEQAGSGLEIQMEISKEGGLSGLENKEMRKAQSLYRKTHFSEISQSIFSAEAQ